METTKEMFISHKKGDPDPAFWDTMDESGGHCEISQTQDDKYCMISLTRGSLKS